MWIAVALCAIIFWLAIFLTFFQADDQASRGLFGKPRGKLPALGVWTRSEQGPDGTYEEERFLLVGRKLYRQRRKRNLSGEVVEVLGEERVDS